VTRQSFFISLKLMHKEGLYQPAQSPMAGRNAAGHDDMFLRTDLSQRRAESYDPQKNRHGEGRQGC
jgi:hypothetical protein